MDSKAGGAVLKTASRFAVAAACGTAVIYLGRKWYLLRTQKPEDREAVAEKKTKDGKKVPAVDGEFFRQLLHLLKICFPSFFSKETLLLVLHTSALFTRTFLSIYVAQLDGYTVKSIVERDLKRFVSNLVKLMVVALPATFINSLIRFFESKLALAFRTRLVNHAYKLYFSDEVYFKVGNLDNRLVNADHSMTEDLKNFSEAIAHIHSHISKPLLDCFMMSVAFLRIANKTGSNAGGRPVMMAVSVTAMTGLILKLVSPHFGKLVAEEAQRYGYLRYIHSRIIANAEEIAFYQGHEVRRPSLPNVCFMLEGLYMENCD